MIRIDEIYNHTFWPWVRDNLKGMRVFFCDPFGHTDPEHLFNLGSDEVAETDYIYFHDQEPVHLDIFEPLFQEVARRNEDLWEPTAEFFEQQRKFGIPDPEHWIRNSEGKCVKPSPLGHVVVSERGEYVEELCRRYEWTPHYYFFHGWACMDWFRGYDKTFLIPRAHEREPTKTFISPNRIVGGKRDHRVLFLYNVFKQGLEHNHISAPRICSQENVDISSIAQKYTNVYQDITNVFDQAELPIMFAGEETQNMSSCWLTNFAEAADSLVYVPTETVYFGRRQHITEKTFKAIALEMPFVLVAPADSLSYLREYGFKTFHNIFDESYDDETDDIRRIEKVTKLLKELDSLTVKERQQIHQACLPIVEHNYRHFYRGDFNDILWTELVAMLNNLEKKLL